MQYSSSNRSPRKTTSAISHQSLYKSPQPRTTSGGADGGQPLSWRTAYKQRCFDELKRSRQTLVNKFRNLNVDSKQTPFKDYLQQELEKICLLEASNNPLISNVDEAIEIQRQTQKELLEMALSDYYNEEILEMLDSEEHLKNASLEPKEVICPLCAKSPLVEDISKGTISCKSLPCKFNIDITKTKLTINQLDARLQQAVSQHCCSEIPYFVFRNLQDVSDQEMKALQQLSVSPQSNCFLLMSCDKCNFMQMIV